MIGSTRLFYNRKGEIEQEPLNTKQGREHRVEGISLTAALCAGAPDGLAELYSDERHCSLHQLGTPGTTTRAVLQQGAALRRTPRSRTTLSAPRR